MAASRIASRAVQSCVLQISSASCSIHSACGVNVLIFFSAYEIISPLRLKMTDRFLTVPESSARIYFFCMVFPHLPK